MLQAGPLLRCLKDRGLHKWMTRGTPINFEQADELNEAIRAIGIRHRALAIAALAPFGIHPGHKLLLLELETAGSCTQAQLAAATGYEPPTITLSVRQLEAAGFVVRRPSVADGRATIVELSDEG